MTTSTDYRDLNFSLQKWATTLLWMHNHISQCTYWHLLASMLSVFSEFGFAQYLSLPSTPKQRPCHTSPPNLHFQTMLSSPVSQLHCYTYMKHSWVCYVCGNSEPHTNTLVASTMLVQSGLTSFQPSCVFALQLAFSIIHTCTISSAERVGGCSSTTTILELLVQTTDEGTSFVVRQ